MENSKIVIDKSDLNNEILEKNIEKSIVDIDEKTLKDIKDIDDNIKIIALDLDGTSLDKMGLKFSDRTKKAFKSAKEKEVHIVIATGRAYHSLPEDLKNVKEIEYAVTSNGAVVYDLKKGKILQSDYLREDTVLKLIKIFRENSCIIDVFLEGKAFVDKEDYQNVLRGVTKFRPKEYIIKTRNPVDDIYLFLEEHKDKIENISVNYMDASHKVIMENLLSGLDDITFTSSVATNNEIGSKGVSKAKGIEKILEILDLDFENLVAMGDNPNDLTMIEKAKIGIAMKNAHKEVLKKADYITDTNVSEGVAKAIETLVLGE